MPCVICGDKVHGMNFNVLTCMSCKAFFRRNALRNKEFKCPMNNSCEMTPITRKFCAKCRLEKCIVAGMKKEWIQTDGNKSQSKKKLIVRQIECDPTCREMFQSYFDKKSDQIKDFSGGESLGLPNFNGSENKTDFVNQTFASLTEAEIAQMLLINIDLENFLSGNNLEKNRLLVDLIQDSVSDESEDGKHPELCLTNETSNLKNMDFITQCLVTDYEIYDFDRNSFDAPQLCPQICYPHNELLSEEQFKLSELMSAYLLLRNPYQRLRHLGYYIPEVSGKLSQYIFARMTRMCYKLDPFGRFDAKQQAALMYSKFHKMLIIRSVLMFDQEKECLNLFDDKNKVTVLIPATIFRQYNNTLPLERHINFRAQFRHEWKQDEVIFALLTVIVLFNPEQELCENRHQQQQNYYLKLRNEYRCYVRLLKRYLELKYPNQTEAHECLTLLMANLKQLYSISTDLQSFFDYCYRIGVQDNPSFGKLLQLDTRDWE